MTIYQSIYFTINGLILCLIYLVGDAKFTIPAVGVEVPNNFMTLIVLWGASLVFLIYRIIEIRDSKSLSKYDITITGLLFITTTFSIAFSKYSSIIDVFLNKWWLILFIVISFLYGGITRLALDGFFQKRSKFEQVEKGLAPYSVAVRAGWRAWTFTTAFVIICFIIAILFNYFIHIFSLKKILQVIVVSFALPLLPYAYELPILILGPKKLRQKIIQKKNVFKGAMDLHEMHYQHIGLEHIRDIKSIDLMEAAHKNDFEQVKSLVDQGEDVDKADARGWTPLMIAVADGHYEVAKFLLENCADPNPVNYLGRAAINYAAGYGNLDMVKLLIDHNADINVSGTYELINPLMAAISKGHAEVVECLIQHGAKLENIDSIGQKITAKRILKKSKNSKINKIIKHAGLIKNKDKKAN